jgi:hypothetical protein
MNWIKLEHLLLKGYCRTAPVTLNPMNHAQLCEQALRLASGLQARGVQRMAVHLEDAGELAVALLGAWRAGVSVLLPADLQPQTRQRWAADVDAVADRSGRPARACTSPPLPRRPGPGCLPAEPVHLRLQRRAQAHRQKPAPTGQRGPGPGSLVGRRPGRGVHHRQRRHAAYLRPVVPRAVAAVRWAHFVRQQLPSPKTCSAPAASTRTLPGSPARPCSSAWRQPRLGRLEPVKRVFSSGGALPADAADSLHQRLGSGRRRSSAARKPAALPGARATRRGSRLPMCN